MVAHFLLNSLTAAGAVKGTLQQLDDSGLGNFWQDSSESFVTNAVAFDDRSYPVTEQTPGDASVAYYGQAIFNSTYTGTIIKGYHDTAASPVANVTVFSEVSYFRNGKEVSFTISDDRVNSPVAKPFIWKMSRRADGSIAATNTIYVSDVDVVDCAFDIEPLTTPGIMVSAIFNLAVSPVGSLGVVVVGPRDQLAIIMTDGNQVEGTTYDISCDVLLSDSTTLQLNGEILTRAAP
jgi:hypothetical protein